MKVIFYLFLIFVLFSCKETVETESESNDDYNERLIDFIISNRNGTYLELNDLYNSTTNTINNEDDENLKLVEILKSKGFKIVEFGRGNYPPLGPRIVSFYLEKDRCKCQVDKIYYYTTITETYSNTERIKCFWKLK